MRNSQRRQEILWISWHLPASRHQASEPDGDLCVPSPPARRDRTTCVTGYPAWTKGCLACKISSVYGLRDACSEPCATHSL